MVDHEHLDWPGLRFQLQSELFLQRRKERYPIRICRLLRERKPTRGPGETRARHWRAGETKIKVESCGQASPVNDHAIGKQLKKVNQLRHCGAVAEHGAVGCQHKSALRPFASLRKGWRCGIRLARR